MSNPTEATRLAQNPDLQDRLLKAMRQRIATVRWRAGYDYLPSKEAKEKAETALYLGYFRLLAIQFALHAGNGEDWWKERRRELCGDARIRSLDSSIAAQEFGDALFLYRPPVPFTEDEVLEAAQIEYYDQIASKGTYYHHIEAQERLVSEQEDKMKREGSIVFPIDREDRDPSFYRRKVYDDSVAGRSVVTPASNGESLDYGEQTEEPTHEFSDDEAHENIINHARLRYEEDDAHVFGRAGSLIYAKTTLLTNARIALQWVFWHIDFKEGRRYEELMVCLGESEEQCGGKTAFKSKAQHLRRKIEWMDEHIAPLLRDDPDLQEVCALLWGDTGLDQTPPTIPPPTLPESLEAKETCSTEREKFFNRQRDSMFVFVSATDNFTQFLDPLRAYEEAQDVPSTLLRAFIALNPNEDDKGRWEFINYLKKVLGEVKAA